MSLRDRIAGEIRRSGPITVERYMDLCLNEPQAGYYATRPRLGEAGDFITAPHVSQMFGELIGLWAAETWAALGGPSRIVLAEMGPGDGTMMSDVLRAARAAPAFAAAAEVWLVETSAPLREAQRSRLGDLPRWAQRLGELPADAPVILLANEVLDCLPIRQAVRVAGGWRERRIAVDAQDILAFAASEPVEPPGAPNGVPEGAVFEWSPAVEALGREVGARVSRARGAALFIDYGRDACEAADTLQALLGHSKRPPLTEPGEADLTAHADFPAFLAGARATGAAVSRIVSQGEFLRRLGVEVRADALARARPDRADVIVRQMRRLISAEGMGTLFKVAAVASPGLNLPAPEMA
ncbi:MAG TPA: SAM-dependent methyltransferase [Caulobacteraceae bacterium]|jgi:SAM-dependent MidA family methyltransferase